MVIGPIAQRTAIILAQQLTENRDYNAAAEFLTGIINKCQPVSIELVEAIARVAYDLKAWEQAQNLWRQVAELRPDDFESHLRAAHALIELNRPNEASVYASKLTRIELPIDPTIDRLVDPVYRQIAKYFKSGDLEKVEALLELCKLPGTYVNKVFGAERGDLSDQQIWQRLRDAQSAWSNSKKEIAARDAVLRDLSGRRVFMVLRQFFLGGSRSRDHELTQALLKSANAAGLTTGFFIVEPFRLPGALTLEQQCLFADELVRQIETFRPDAVVFDELGQDVDPRYLGRAALREVLTELRSKLGFKLIGIYQDAWDSNVIKSIQYAAEFADAVWYHGPEIQPERGAVHSATLCQMPYPYPDELFRNPDVSKDINAGFSGSVTGYNYLRALWFFGIQRFRIPVQLFLTAHERNRSPGGDSIESYARFISRMKIVVNFAARTPWSSLVTGRVWESMHAGALLLEEDNSETSKYFVPFVHYVPFKSLAEVHAYLSFFERHDEARCTIVQAAQKLMDRAYSKTRIWSEILNAAGLA